MAGIVAVTAIVLLFTAKLAFAQSQGVPTSGPAENGSPAWFMQGTYVYANLTVDASGHVTETPRAARGGGEGGMASAAGNVPNCSHSPVCDNKMANGVGPRTRNDLQRVEWNNTLGYTYKYPYVLPPGPGGAVSVALDSKGNLWVFQREVIGKPQLFKFDPNHKLILTVGDDVIGHQEKAHGVAVDAEDNVWICDANAATITKLSPDGKVLMVLGEHNHRGDWIEEKGQRLLWQPVMLAFAHNGDIYIAEGHGNESPNDTDSPDPTNVSGAARILHLDKNGKYINQWYGDKVGQGKFMNSHALAIDPTNGDVWIGDREDYRIVVYTANGEFLKTIVMRNLICAMNFDSQGNLWMASGHDGQFLKLTRNGKVVGAIGGGMGIGTGQFLEASYFVFDKQNNIYTGDTDLGRVTEMVAPKK
jgi:sugar lactone lactonase YvrE